MGYDSMVKRVLKAMSHDSDSDWGSDDDDQTQVPAPVPVFSSSVAPAPTAAPTSIYANVPKQVFVGVLAKCFLIETDPKCQQPIPAVRRSTLAQH